MKRVWLRVLIAILVLSALPVGGLTASASSKLGYMYEGDVISLIESIEGLADANIAWISSDESVVTAMDGNIEAHAAGRAVIGAWSGSAKVRFGVVVLPREVTVKVGEIVSLPSSGKEKYGSENKTIAAINKKGQILGCAVGNTQVAVSYGKKVMTVAVNVVDDTVMIQPEDALAQDNNWLLQGDPWTAPGFQQSAAAELDCANTANQIVLVEYQGGSEAQISIHQKQNGVWTQLYSDVAYVGRNGIGKTKEGDGKTPSGTYNLTIPFGLKADPGAKMSYTQVDENYYWCGTSSSEYYNQLVDMRDVNRRYTSSDEYLINYGGYYDYCMFIDYNAAGEAGLGSCIFLHCKGNKNSTGGCIAVSEAVMKNILKWAEPGAKIVIR